MTTKMSLLHESFASGATAQQAPQNIAIDNATGTQQAPAKPASLLDIARNKLRNKHATSSENGTQQAHTELRKLVAEVYSADTNADQAEALAAALADPDDALICYRAIVAETRATIAKAKG
jgi:Spy/CpxP family protein refolding chaperone